MLDKADVRRRAQVLRDGEADRPRKSAVIRQRIEQLPEYRNAGVVASYIGINSEVDTRDLVVGRLAQSAATSVVYRVGIDLKLAFIHFFEELAQGTFGLWEPVPDVRQDPKRHCRVTEVDLFLVPGLAFDRRGGRIGYGRGFYDRLLARARADAVFLGLAFEGQLVSRVPMTDDDLPVHLIVTEKQVYRTDAADSS